MTGPTQQELEAEQLENTREKQLTLLRENKFNLQLSPQKDRVMKTLKLTTLFDETEQTIRNAKKEEKINQAYKKAPTNIIITNEKTTTTYPDEEELDEYIELFLEAKNVDDEKLRKQYEHNIKDTSNKVSIKTTITTATVQYPDKNEQYTIVDKKITSPENTYNVEIIPKTFAQDVSKLRIEGNHEVIESDPIIKFTNKEYTYSTQKNNEEAGYTIVIPKELAETGFITGLLSFEIGGGNTTRNLIYLFLTIIFVVGITAGTKIAKNKSGNTTFDEFALLAGQALDLVAQGKHQQASNITPDIISIFETLPANQQTQLQEIIEALKNNHEEQHFLGRLSNTYETTSLAGGDINTLSHAYEEILSHYEQLPTSLQHKLKPHLEQLDEYLDEAVQ